ncbi:hypothetical protein [Mycobacterium avium]|nr:hypothetical protein [Mycobacterium avium]
MTATLQLPAVRQVVAKTDGVPLFVATKMGAFCGRKKTGTR